MELADHRLQTRKAKANPRHTVPITQSPLQASTIQRAIQDASALSPADVQQLQSRIGNQAVSQLMARSTPPASNQAATIRRSPQPATTDQPLAIGPEGGAVDGDLEKKLHRSKSRGQNVPAQVQRQVGQATGADFSTVRVHQDGNAHALNSQLQAKAFTHGNHIFLGKNQTPNNVQLMAHELTHTVQQGASPALQRASDGLIQCWPGDKKKPTGDSFDNPKHFKNPKLLKKDRSKKTYGLKGAPMYAYDSKTGTIGDQPVDNVESDFEITKKVYKTRTLPDGSKEKGIISGEHWIPADQFEKRKAQYVDTQDTPLETYTANRTDSDGNKVQETKYRLPKPADVRQESIGDCWLEAALISIVATDPGYIQGMLRDNGDKVTVRLYKVDRSNPKKPTFTPRFIQVDKSTVMVGQKGLYQSGSLWVHMIQKAYTAGGFTGTGERKSVSSKRPGEFTNIVGGQTHHAYEVLLGRPGQKSKVDSGKAQNKPKMKELPWSPAEIEMYLKVARPNDNYDGLVSYANIFKDKAKVDKWFTWARRRKNSNAIDNLFTQKRKLALHGVAQGAKLLGKSLGGYQSEIRLENLKELFEAKGLDNELIAPLLQYLQHYFPGKRGTAKYTDRQVEIYTQIRTALDNKQTVSAGTPRVVGRASTGKGQSADEEMSKGLVGGHAYAVLDAYEGDNGRYVKVHNPWGKYRRDYDRDSGDLKAKAQDKGAQSLLELSDFTKRFDELYVS